MTAEREHPHAKPPAGEEAPEDGREEYASYRETDPDVADPDAEAVREADLQPGTPKAERDRDPTDGAEGPDPD